MAAAVSWASGAGKYPTAAKPLTPAPPRRGEPGSPSATRPTLGIAAAHSQDWKANRFGDLEKHREGSERKNPTKPRGVCVGAIVFPSEENEYQVSKVGNMSQRFQLHTQLFLKALSVSVVDSKLILLCNSSSALRLCLHKAEQSGAEDWQLFSAPARTVSRHTAAFGTAHHNTSTYTALWFSQTASAGYYVCALTRVQRDISAQEEISCWRSTLWLLKWAQQNSNVLKQHLLECLASQQLLAATVWFAESCFRRNSG